MHDVKTELNYQLTEVAKVPTSDTSVQCNSLETSHLYVDVANINTLINPQLRQLEFEVSKLKDKILAIENKRQKEAEKDMVYIMGE